MAVLMNSFSSGDAFDIKRDDLRMGAGSQVFHAVDDIDIGLVSHAESGAETHAVAVEVIEHLGHETAALGGESDKSGRACHRVMVVGLSLR